MALTLPDPSAWQGGGRRAGAGAAGKGSSTDGESSGC